MGLIGWLFRRRHQVPGGDTRPSGTGPGASGEAGYVVLDVETTGLSPRWDRVVELAVVHVGPRGVATTEWTTRVNPDGPVGATHIHGITDADVAHAPRFAELVPQLTAHLSGQAVVAHNAAFDLAFLRAEYQRAGWQMPWLPALCTQQASHHYLPHLDRRRLRDCCAASKIPLRDAHSALGDSRAAAALLAHYLDPRRRPTPLSDHLDLPRQAGEVVWPSKPTGPTGDTRTRRPGAGTTRRAVPRAPAPSLLANLDTLPLADAVDEGAPPGTLGYLQLLTEVLRDGEVTHDEAAGLAALAQEYGFGADDIVAANTGYLLALAHRALEDGRVSQAERADLLNVARLLRLPEALVRHVLDRAEKARHSRLGAHLLPLPAGWQHGEPLRVGDKVVFTGCERALRGRLEARADRLGIRVLGVVSARTAMLVTDGTYDGNKTADADRLGTRTVTPEQFDVLLTHLQPARLPSTADPSGVGDGRPAHDPGTVTTARTPESGTVRRWALDQGMDVSGRGRLPAAVVSAYRNANPT